MVSSFSGLSTMNDVKPNQAEGSTKSFLPGLGVVLALAGVLWAGGVYINKHPIGDAAKKPTLRQKLIDHSAVWALSKAAQELQKATLPGADQVVIEHCNDVHTYLERETPSPQIRESLKIAEQGCVEFAGTYASENAITPEALGRLNSQFSVAFNKALLAENSQNAGANAKNKAQKTSAVADEAIREMAHWK